MGRGVKPCVGKVYAGAVSEPWQRLWSLQFRQASTRRGRDSEEGWDTRLPVLQRTRREREMRGLYWASCQPPAQREEEERVGEREGREKGRRLKERVGEC